MPKIENMMEPQCSFPFLKMMFPDTRIEFSVIKTKIETIRMYQFKHDISKAKLNISEWMNDISIEEETCP